MDLDLVAELFGTLDQGVANGGPASIDSEGLYVLHHEGPRFNGLDNIKEMKDVPASRIIPIHLADNRKSLARWTADHDVGFDSGRRRGPKHVVADDVIAYVTTVGLASPWVDLVRPNDVEASPTESIVEPACA
jgi:hypothetical protein